MSQAVTSQTLANSQQSQLSPTMNLVRDTVCSAGVTALIAGIFTSISPLGGAIFGATIAISGRPIQWICNQINCCPNSLVGKASRVALSWLGSIATAALVATLAGFPITFTAGATLTITTVVAVGALACCIGCIEQRAG